MEVPGWLGGIFLVTTGETWPEADEDRLRALAAQWRRFAERLPPVQQAMAVDGHALEFTWSGRAQQAFRDEWDRLLRAGTLEGVVQAAWLMAEYTEKAWLNVDYAKKMIIGQLGIIAATIGSLVPWLVMPGLSAWAYAHISALQSFGRLIAHAWMRELAASLAYGLAWNLVTQVGLDVAVQAQQTLAGGRREWDTDKTLGAVITAGIGLAVGQGLRASVNVAKVGRLHPSVLASVQLVAGGVHELLTEYLADKALTGRKQGVDDESSDNQWAAFTAGVSDEAIDMLVARGRGRIVGGLPDLSIVKAMVLGESVIVGEKVKLVGVFYDSRVYGPLFYGTIADADVVAGGQLVRDTRGVLLASRDLPALNRLIDDPRFSGGEVHRLESDPPRPDDPHVRAFVAGVLTWDTTTSTPLTGMSISFDRSGSDHEPASTGDIPLTTFTSQPVSPLYADLLSTTTEATTTEAVTVKATTVEAVMTVGPDAGVTSDAWAGAVVVNDLQTVTRVDEAAGATGTTTSSAVPGIPTAVHPPGTSAEPMAVAPSSSPTDKDDARTSAVVPDSANPKAGVATTAQTDRNAPFATAWAANTGLRRRNPRPQRISTTETTDGVSEPRDTPQGLPGGSALFATTVRPVGSDSTRLSFGNAPGREESQTGSMRLVRASATAADTGVRARDTHLRGSHGADREVPSEGPMFRGKTPEPAPDDAGWRTFASASPQSPTFEFRLHPSGYVELAGERVIAPYEWHAFGQGAISAHGVLLTPNGRLAPMPTSPTSPLQYVLRSLTRQAPMSRTDAAPLVERLLRRHAVDTPGLADPETGDDGAVAVDRSKARAMHETLPGELARTFTPDDVELIVLSTPNLAHADKEEFIDFLARLAGELALPSPSTGALPAGARDTVDPQPWLPPPQYRLMVYSGQVVWLNIDELGEPSIPLDNGRDDRGYFLRQRLQAWFSNEIVVPFELTSPTGAPAALRAAQILADMSDRQVFLQLTDAVQRMWVGRTAPPPDDPALAAEVPVRVVHPGERAVWQVLRDDSDGLVVTTHSMTQHEIDTLRGAVLALPGAAQILFTDPAGAAASDAGRPWWWWISKGVFSDWLRRVGWQGQSLIARRDYTPEKHDVDILGNLLSGVSQSAGVIVFLQTGDTWKLYQPGRRVPSVTLRADAPMSVHIPAGVVFPHNLTIVAAAATVRPHNDRTLVLLHIDHQGRVQLATPNKVLRPITLREFARQYLADIDLRLPVQVVPLGVVVNRSIREGISSLAGELAKIARRRALRGHYSVGRFDVYSPAQGYQAMISDGSVLSVPVDPNADGRQPWRRYSQDFIRFGVPVPADRVQGEPPIGVPAISARWSLPDREQVGEPLILPYVAPPQVDETFGWTPLVLELDRDHFADRYARIDRVAELLVTRGQWPRSRTTRAKAVIVSYGSSWLGGASLRARWRADWITESFRKAYRNRLAWSRPYLSDGLVYPEVVVKLAAYRGSGQRTRAGSLQLYLPDRTDDIWNALDGDLKAAFSIDDLRYMRNNPFYQPRPGEHFEGTLALEPERHTDRTIEFLHLVQSNPALMRHLENARSYSMTAREYLEPDYEVVGEYRLNLTDIHQELDVPRRALHTVR